MNAITRHWDAVRASLADEKTRGERLRYEETAFLPAALEIVEQPVSPTGRRTAWALLALLAATILWLTFGKLDVVASAPGKLIPAANVQLIQPSEQGVVHAILVEDGQHVRAGQPLISLDPTVSTAEAVQAQKALEVAQADAARSRTVLDALDGKGFHFAEPPGMSKEVADAQVALAHAQVTQIQSDSSAHRADTAAARSALGEAQTEAKKLGDSLPLLDQQIAAYQSLDAEGYASKLRILDLQRQRLTTAGDRDAAIQTAQRQRSAIDEASGNGSKAIAEARATVLGDLNKAEADAKLRTEELAKASRRSTLQILRSPLDGTVAELAVHTVGGVVEAAKPIMVVVPDGGSLMAEVKLFNRDAGGVHAGQPVAIKLEAYPFTRYGVVAGTLVTVDGDAVEDEKLGLYYRALVRIDAKAGDLAKRDVRLGSGMALTADIRTGRRSILSYLVSPIDAAARDAAREQ